MYLHSYSKPIGWIVLLYMRPMHIVLRLSQVAGNPTLRCPLRKTYTAVAYRSVLWAEDD